MSLNSTTALKWGAFVLAVLWTGTMLSRTGATGSVEISALVFCGVVGSYGWYQIMCASFRRFGLLPPERDETAEARRGKIYPYVVLVVVVVGGQLLTKWLLGLIDPLVAAGNWRQLTWSLFVFFVYPGLMLALWPLLRRHLPPPKRRAGSGRPPA